MNRKLHILRDLVLQFLLLMTFVHQAHANAQSILDKKVDLVTEKIELKKMLREVQKQTGVEFIYSSDVVKVNKKVACKLPNKRLGDFFNYVLKPLGISKNHLQRFCESRVVGVRAEHVLQRPEYQRERCSKFMANVAEEHRLGTV